MKLYLYQIDAFTDKVFGGNPACVVPLTKWLEDEKLLKLLLIEFLSFLRACISKSITFFATFFKLFFFIFNVQKYLFCSLKFPYLQEWVTLLHFFHKAQFFFLFLTYFLTYFLSQIGQRSRADTDIQGLPTSNDSWILLEVKSGIGLASLLVKTKAA